MGTIIGTFSPTDAGGFNGAIRTLQLQGKVAIVPARGAVGAGQPDYLVFLGRDPLGAAWREPNGENVQLRVRLEHPSFANPVNAELSPRDARGRVYSLIWRRGD